MILKYLSTKARRTKKTYKLYWYGEFYNSFDINKIQLKLFGLFWATVKVVKISYLVADKKYQYVSEHLQIHINEAKRIVDSIPKKETPVTVLKAYSEPLIEYFAMVDNSDTNEMSQEILDKVYEDARNAMIDMKDLLKRIPTEAVTKEDIS